MCVYNYKVNSTYLWDCVYIYIYIYISTIVLFHKDIHCAVKNLLSGMLMCDITVVNLYKNVFANCEKKLCNR